MFHWTNTGYETVWAAAYAHAAEGKEVQSFSVLFCDFCQSSKITDFVIEGIFFAFISYNSSLQYFYTDGKTFLSLTGSLFFFSHSSPSLARTAEKLSSTMSFSPWKCI